MRLFDSVYGPAAVAALEKLGTPGDTRRRGLAAYQLARIERAIDIIVEVLHNDVEEDLVEEYYEIKHMCNLVAMTKFSPIIWAVRHNSD